MRRHADLLPIVVLGLALSGLSSAATDTPTHAWCSMAIEVRGLPDGAQGVPVSTFINFSQILQDANIPGVADTRSLRLIQLSSTGGTSEVPVQFSPAPQPRLKGQPLLPGTSSAVSYLGEYRPNEAPKEAQVAGLLSWIATNPSDGTCRYRLEFGVPRTGWFVQVPYPPQDLRAFAADGRATPVRWFPRLQTRPLQPLAGGVDILDNHQLVCSYHVGPQMAFLGSNDLAIRRPFLYPVNGPDGIGLTDFGKSHDPTASHTHHYSIWIAHASVNGQDFWSERGGLIAHESFELQEDGPVFCRLVQKARWLLNPASASQKPQPIINERRTLTFYRAEADSRLIDVELEVTPAGSQPVTLGQTNFGFLAVRIAQSMTAFDGGGEILNSVGDRNERQAHEKRAQWIDQSGPIDENRWAGVAIFDHPDNPKHPTYWHCRNDGWAGAALNLKEAYQIEPSTSLHLKYRLCLHRYDAVRGGVAQHYAQYEAKPQVHLGPVSIKR